MNKPRFRHGKMPWTAKDTSIYDANGTRLLFEGSGLGASAPEILDRTVACVNAFAGVPGKVLAELCSPEMQALDATDRFIMLGTMIKLEQAAIKRGLSPERLVDEVLTAFDGGAGS